MSSEDSECIQHLIVEYRGVDGEHVTTWHIELTEAEYQTFRQIEQSDEATLAVESFSSLVLDDATICPPLSP